MSNTLFTFKPIAKDQRPKTKDQRPKKIMIPKSTTIIIALLATCSAFSQVCFKTFSLEDCKYQIVNEFKVAKRLPPSDRNDFNPGLELGLNLGLHKHISKEEGYGVHGFFDAFAGSGGAIQVGLSGRYSRYFKDKWVLNFSPGLIVYHSRNNDFRSFTQERIDYGFLAGMTMEASISYKHNIGVFTRFDHLNDRNGPNENILAFGLKSGGLGGSIGTGAAVLTGVGLVVALLLSL